MAVIKNDFISPSGWDWSLLKARVDNVQPSPSSFTARDASASEQYMVPWDDSYKALLNILGYSYTTSQGTLARIPPIRHPYWNNYYAVEITDARGIKFDGKADYRFPGSIPSDSVYEFLSFSVTFKPLPFRVKEDSEVTSETERFVSYSYEPKTEFLSRQIGQLKYAETRTVGGPVLTGTGTAFPGRVIAVENKVNLEVVWHQVPEDFIVDTASGYVIPDKIVAAAGKVNSQAFLGFPAGTLLALDPVVTRYPAVYLPATVGDDLFYCDVRFRFIWHDPPRGKDPGAYTRGHNLKPFYTTAVDEVYYYYVTNTGATTGKAIYGSYDFNNCFTYWGA